MNEINNLKCNTFVVKLASRCNIKCKYCYMFRMGDESFKSKPRIMSSSNMEKMIFRAKEHCISTNSSSFTFVLHGGEPLLIGKSFINDFADTVKNIFKDTSINPKLSLQTNGTLITDEWCDLFIRNNISIGISLDGLKDDNDSNRVDSRGNGTYERIINGIKICQRNGINPGLLSVINPNSDPIKIYNLFKELNVVSADFLLPEATYNNRPTCPTKGKYIHSETPYADWLIDLFNIWVYDKQRIYNRHFQQYIHSLLGGEISGDDMGSLYNEVLVVDTNGDYEAEDALRICGNYFTKSDVNVMTSSVTEAMEAKLSKEYYFSHKRLPIRCIACPINETCGGGYFPHRYNSMNGFNNPSVYCNDLVKLITHIQNIIVDEIPTKLRNMSGISKLTYSQALQIINETLPSIPEPSYSHSLESFREK